MKLVPAVDIGEALPDLSQSRFALPFTALGRSYYAAAYGEGATDHSFGFADADGWCALVPCNAARPDALTWYEFPIEIWVRPGLSAASMRKLARDILGTLRQRARSIGATHVRLREAHDPLLNGILSALLLEKELVASPSFAVLVDLSLPDDELFAAMRSGHRQQVRAGERIMALTHVDADNPDRDLFDRYRELHAEVSGRVTRPRASWDRMFDLVAAGQGHLVLSRWQGELLGGTLMLDAGEISYYASGAYLRNHFDKPLAHYPLFTAIQRARARGRRQVHIGEVIPPLLMDSAKERSINSFKLGFSGSVAPSRIWTIGAQG